MTMTIHIGKFQQQDIYGRNTISGKGNVQDVIVRYLIIRKDDVIPCSEIIVIMIVFCGHILYMIWKSYVNLYAGESEKVVLGNLIMKYCFPEVVNLLKECVECYMTIVISCVMMVLKLKSLMSILWLKGHRNVNGRSWFRNSDHARSMIRLTM